MTGQKKAGLELMQEMYSGISTKLKRVWNNHPWPVIRVHVLYLFHVSVNEKDKKDSGTSFQYKHYGFSLKEILGLVYRAILLLFWSLKFNNRLNKKVLLTGFWEHVGNHGNIYIHPCQYELNGLGIDNEICWVSMFGKPVDDNPLNTLYRQLYYFEKIWFKCKNFFNSGQNRKAFQNAKIVRDWLEEKNIADANRAGRLIYENQIEQEVQHNTFLRLLKITKPKHIWTYCYYDNKIMALIRAANTLHIGITEYQHSAQYDDHFAYASWPDIDQYRNCFPSTFWIWRNSDANRIEQNFTGQSFKPGIIRGGNIFLAQQKKSNSSSVHNEKINVLVTLQGMWIPGFIEKFISNSKSYKWYFRLHPRYPQDKEKLQEFKRQYPEKIVMEEANTVSLYDLFQKMQFNITSYSGTALEAQAFGIRNIIYGQEGFLAFRHYIENGVFDYVEREEDMENAFTKSFEGGNADFDSILTDRESIRHQLNLLVS